MGFFNFKHDNSVICYPFSVIFEPKNLGYKLIHFSEAYFYLLFFSPDDSKKNPKVCNFYLPQSSPAVVPVGVM